MMHGNYWLVRHDKELLQLIDTLRNLPHTPSGGTASQGCILDLADISLTPHGPTHLSRRIGTSSKIRYAIRPTQEV